MQAFQPPVEVLGADLAHRRTPSCPSCPSAAARLPPSAGTSPFSATRPMRRPMEQFAVPDQEHSRDPDCIPGSVLAEHMLCLSKAARHLPTLRGKKPPHPATLYRWATAGRKSRSGRIVYLEIWRVGGTNCTSVEAIARFLDALNDIPPAGLASQPHSSPRTPCPPGPKPNLARSQRQAADALSLLRQRGLVE